MSAVTSIDFYLLRTSSLASYKQFICRLVEKVFYLGHNIYVHAEDNTMLEHFDEHFWTYRSESFLPHMTGKQKSGMATVMLGCEKELAQTDERDVLVNLDSTIPLFFSNFKRMIAVVYEDNAHKQVMREHYQFYQSRGYAIKTHQI